MRISNPMGGFQSLGRALMLPIAVLPAAGLLLRLGQPDLLDIAIVAAAGDAIFANLGLLFAIGVAVGFAKDGNGAAGLAGVVCYFVATYGAKISIDIPSSQLEGVPEAYLNMVSANLRDQTIARLSIPIGILSGCMAGLLYNRYSAIKLPDYLAFFGGRRFVPIAAAFAGLVCALLLTLLVGPLNFGVGWLSDKILEAGGVGLFAYGVLNRLLIVTGLHHILNNVAWFIVGDFQGATGDLNRFFSGDPSAGGFMSGFFPVMMFGLPAACYAMYRAAPPDRRKEVGGMYASMALTSFLTGVTEPIEFTFMFVAPILYGIHAILTGASMVIMDLLNVKLGFGFSAGLFDYLINFNASTNPLLLLPIGGLYALLYYALFSFAIRFLNLKTPGFGDAKKPDLEAGELEQNYVLALGGSQNLVSISACATRLRLQVGDDSSIDEAALKALGAKAVVKPSRGNLQVIIGPQAELIASGISRLVENHEASPKNEHQVKDVLIEDLPTAWIAFLGGAENVTGLKIGAERRLLATLIDPLKIRAIEADENPPLIPVNTSARAANSRQFLMMEDLSLAKVKV